MRLLYATDGSEEAVYTGRWLAALPWETQPEVDVVTVIPERVPYSGPVPPGVFPGMEQIERVRDEEAAAAEHVVAQGADPFQRWTPSPRCWVRRGDLATEILDLARERAVGWIVIGARGVTSAPQFPLGGVALALLKLAPCSVLVVTAGARPPRRLIVATDLSETADRAVEVAARLPLAPQTRAVVLHVLQEHPLLRDLAAPVAAQVRETLAAMQRAQREAVATLLERSADRLRTRGWVTEVEVREGAAAEQILSAAADCGADWIVMGARGLSPTPELALGSVSQKVALSNPGALLVVRRPAPSTP